VFAIGVSASSCRLVAAALSRERFEPSRLQDRLPAAPIRRGPVEGVDRTLITCREFAISSIAAFTSSFRLLPAFLFNPFEAQ
jgi:hypothetical protein